ncbi:RNA polymerase sigma factor [Pseudonocardia phyllosphaerae]|uniref:RNA polymerase sigma factor n=1 Tax=Pseudonocardia phyllosphaerae TaxID=3390502 RepID=UPI00397DF54E
MSPGRGGLDAAADAWLIEKAKEGTPEAYEELVRRHRDRIYRIALRMVGNSHDAEDVAQDVVLTLFTALVGFSGGAKFTTWIYRVVVNRCINLINKRQGHEPLEDPDVATTPGADRQAEARGQVKAAMAAVTELPTELRAPVVLVDIEQMSYQEVAAILNVSEATVRGRLHRGRRKLLETLREWT